MERKVMDEKVRARLQGLAPFSIDSSLEFVPASYTYKEVDEEGNETEEYMIPEEYHPKFKVRPWNRKESNEAVKALMDFGKTTDDTKVRELTRKAILGWENLIDIATETEIVYEADPGGGAKKDLIESFTITLILDISNKISNISGLNKHGDFVNRDEKLGLKS